VEVTQMVTGIDLRTNDERVLGEPRLSQLRRPMAGTAVLGRLNWRVSTVTSARDETATARTIALRAPGHDAGRIKTERFGPTGGLS
jgi:hypothetical protein